MKFYFRFGQLIGFPVWGQLCCGCQGEESKTCFSGNILYTLSKVVFHQKSSCVKSRLPSGVIFRQRSSFVKGRLLLKVVFRQRSSFVKSHLPSKVVFHRRSSSSFGSFSFCPAPCAFQQCATRLLSKVVFCQRSSSVKSRLLSKVLFCQKLSSVKDVFLRGRLPLLGHFYF